MFKLYGVYILCLLVLHQVDCQAVDNAQLDGPLEDKSFSVQEGSIGGMYLYRFKFEPPVVSLRLTGEKDGIIEMRPDGVLYLNGPLDWETKKVHRLQVEGLNVNGQRVKGPYSITIYVKDINDNPPEFDKKRYQGTVRQKSRAGKPFMYVKASDRDDPSTPNGQLSYKLRQHFPNPLPEMLFQIDNVTGAISTTDAGALNLNPAVVSSFLLDVEAHDMAGQSVNAFSCTTSVEVTVLENLWKSPPPVKIRENSTEPHPISITQVQWNNPGAKYEISSKEKPPMKLPFMIDQNGTIYVTEPLDREEKDSYSFYAFAKDEDGDILLAPPVIVMVTVEDINDNPPVCDKALIKFEVQENEAVGNLIGTVRASDADQGGTIASRLEYHIIDQNPKIPVDNVFRIDSGAGTINLLQNALRKQIVSNYSLKVEVTDPAFRTVCDVQINVIDINDQIPIFEKSDYGYITLPENKPVGTVIMEIQANDGDEPFTGSSQIVYAVKKGDPNNTFSIQTDPKTNRGYVTINKVLDFETTPAYELLISATNPEPLVAGIQYNSSSLAYLRLNVTDVDEAPIFFPPIYIVDRYENVSVGTVVTTAMAYDPERARIRYSLKNNNRNWLRIDPLNGTIYTASPLDRETERAYMVQVVATEQTKAYQSSTAQLILNLKDVNDNPPKLAKDFLFFCHPLQGNERAKIEVTDPDEFSYIPRFTYVLLGDSTIQNSWNVSKDGLHAYISPKNINLEEKTYDIPIQMNDNGRPPMQGVVYLQVKVCRCVEKRCFLEIDTPSSLPTVAMAVGILVAVLVVIGVILGIVFLRLKHKKQNQQKATRANAASPSELQNLT
ncbi:cadherin-17 [Sceloporus undulatus]|uniref:cadherin-17 n=1 Tax=Sceloporus undulatus TaxID=8520 RepID=UPI001C4B9359|nr:cadherin-17 [Sceloporus undulatus]